MLNCKNHKECSLLPLVNEFNNVFHEPVPDITFKEHKNDWYETQDKLLANGDDFNYDGPLTWARVE
jgi:hypothetical protein